MSDEEPTRAGWSSPSGGQQPPTAPQQPSYPQQQAGWDQSAYGQPGYEQQPYAYGQQPAYGQPGYGQQPAYAYAPTAAADAKRPVTVTVAAWLAIVFSGLFVLFAIAMTSFAFAGFDELVDDVDGDAGAGAVVASLLVMAVIGAVGVLGGVLSLRRSVGGRVLLTVMSCLAAVFWLLTIAVVVTIVPLAASIATVVLLFVGGANDWFARRVPAQPGGAPGPYGGAPGPYGGAPYGGGPKGW
jgi:hypothetical protein